MKRMVVLVIFVGVTAVAHGQSALELLNIANEAPSIDDMKSAPAGKGETIIKTGPCGEVWVTSEQTNGSTMIRTTYQRQRPVVIAFCWLDEIRSRFNTAQRNAEGTEKEQTVIGFIRTAQLTAVSDPKSYYNRLKDIYCSNGGTFFMDLTNAVRECPTK